MLALMLPIARRKAEQESDPFIMPLSEVGEAQWKYLTEDNLDAVMVYEISAGAWHADVVMKKVPEDTPNGLGSPISSPLQSRGEAMQFAQSVLTSVMLIAKANREKRPFPQRVFTLFDHPFELRASVLNEVIRNAARLNPYASKDDAINRTREMLAQVGFADSYSPDKLKHLTRNKAIVFFSAIYSAAAHGILEWPPKKTEDTCSMQR